MTAPVRKHLTLSATPAPASDGGEMVFVASSFTPDRVGDRVDVSKMNLSEFRKNPVMVIQHDTNQLPAGTWKVWVEGTGTSAVLYCSPVFSDSAPMGPTVKSMVTEGTLRAVSIGFLSESPRPNSHGGVDHVATTLTEISLVTVPCHPEAVRIKALPETEPEASPSVDSEPAPAAPAEPTLADLMARLDELAALLAELKASLAPAPEDKAEEIPAAPEEPSEEEKSFRSFCAYFK